MATASEVAVLRQAQSDVVALAAAEIERFWRTLDLSDLVGAARALEAFLPDVIQAFGEIGAVAAADFYDSLREQSPAAYGAYRAVLGDAIPLDQARASSRWAVKPFFERSEEGLLVPRPAQALTNVIQVADRLVKGQARRTIQLNADLDPARPRYARIPTGSSTCAFCLTMASRGPVYTSEARALAASHGDCDCVLSPFWDGDPLPEGYDPEALDRIYRQAAQASDGSLKGPDGILAAMREQTGAK